MADSFGTFLQGGGELDNPLSRPRLLLAAAVAEGQPTDRELREATGWDEKELRDALQVLASKGLVTVRPQKGSGGSLVIEPTKEGKLLAGG
jgi:hypothetical protein